MHTSALLQLLATGSRSSAAAAAGRTQAQRTQQLRSLNALCAQIVVVIEHTKKLIGWLDRCARARARPH